MQGANDPPCYMANLRRDVKRRVREQLAAEKGGLLIKVRARACVCVCVCVSWRVGGFGPGMGPAGGQRWVGLHMPEPNG